MKSVAVAVLLCAFALFAQARAGTVPPEPDGYRTSDYRSAVPGTVNGKAALTTEETATLWREKVAILIDTLPQPPRPAGLPASTIWHPKPRYDIPGSIWLPDTGYGDLPAIMESYFEKSLTTATNGDRSRRLIFYCLSNCWMSWNAAKHAASLGYTQVDWYADGTDGWTAHDLPLELRESVPRPVQ